jgi:hypothetical protein
MHRLLVRKVSYLPDPEIYRAQLQTCSETVPKKWKITTNLRHFEIEALVLVHSCSLYGHHLDKVFDQLAKIYPQCNYEQKHAIIQKFSTNGENTDLRMWKRYLDLIFYEDGWKFYREARAEFTQWHMVSLSYAEDLIKRIPPQYVPNLVESFFTFLQYPVTHAFEVSNAIMLVFIF